MNSGRSASEVDDYLRRAADEGQDMATIADAMGPAGGRALAGAARQPGPGRTAAVDFVESRQRDQGDRLAQFLSDGLDLQDTAAMRRAQEVASRADDAGVNYTAARASAGPVNVGPALRRIDDILGRDPLLGDTSLKSTALGNRLARFRGMLGNDSEQLIDFDSVRAIRTDLREYMEQNPKARAVFSDLYDDLTNALSDASPDFRAANDAYRSASGVIDAVDEGRAMARPGSRYQDVAERYSGMPADAQSAARSGYGNEVLAKIENARVGANKAEPLRTTRNMQNLRLMARDPDMLERQIGREADMAGTRQAIVGGSQTAELLADQAAANSEDVSIIANLLSNRPGAAMGQVAGRAANAMRGQNEGTRAEIVRMLLANRPNDLSRALSTASNREGVKRVIESMLRGNIRGAGVPLVAN